MLQRNSGLPAEGRLEFRVGINLGEVLFGEISLSGAVRPVAQPEARLREAAKLGFSRAVVPPHMQPADESGIGVRQTKHLGELVSDLFGD